MQARKKVKFVRRGAREDNPEQLRKLLVEVEKYSLTKQRESLENSGLANLFESLSMEDANEPDKMSDKELLPPSSESSLVIKPIARRTAVLPTGFAAITLQGEIQKRSKADEKNKLSDTSTALRKPTSFISISKQS